MIFSATSLIVNFQSPPAENTIQLRVSTLSQGLFFYVIFILIAIKLYTKNNAALLELSMGLKI